MTNMIPQKWCEFHKNCVSLTSKRYRNPRNKDIYHYHNDIIRRDMKFSDIENPDFQGDKFEDRHINLYPNMDRFKKTL